MIMKFSSCSELRTFWSNSGHEKPLEETGWVKNFRNEIKKKIYWNILTQKSIILIMEKTFIWITQQFPPTTLMLRSYKNLKNS